MRKCPQVRAYIKEIESSGEKELELERINPVINGKIPSRKGLCLDDKQQAFVLFGDVDRLFTSHEQSTEIWANNSI